MSLPTRILSAIQSAGAAVYTADAELKTAAQAYADQVKEAMQLNPFDLANDTLFEDWKTVARLSQALTQIEAEFRKIFEAASSMSAASLPTLSMVPALGAVPVAPDAQPLEVLQEIQATDAVVKRPSRKAAQRRSRPDGKLRPLSGNTGKVWKRLQVLLNPDDFAKLNQSSVAGDIGIPKGSIGASIAKLVAKGLILAGPGGTFRLASKAI